MLCLLPEELRMGTYPHIPQGFGYYIPPIKNPYMHSRPWPGPARATYDDRTGVLKHLRVRTVLAHAPYGPVHAPYGNRMVTVRVIATLRQNIVVNP